MTDQILTQAEKGADAAGEAIKEKTALLSEEAAAEVEANITTARERVHGLGHDVKVVAEWLVATTRGAVVDVADAIRWIGHEL